jgi:hypothetical protein
VEERDGHTVECRDIRPLHESGETARCSSRKKRNIERNQHTLAGSRRSRTLQPQVVISMGDKSPKAKDKAKKQDAADKNQKKAAANAKANARTNAAAAVKKSK